MIWVLRIAARVTAIVSLLNGLMDAGDLASGRPATPGNVIGLILSVVVVVACWAILRWMLPGEDQGR